MRVTVEDNPRLPYLRDKTSKLSHLPGCYIMKNKGGNIIYIGKAKNLHNRVSSYFRDSDHLTKVAKMVSNVYDYDFIVTASEYEALVLENSLIKQHKPKYNILLKDDKGYSYIKISAEEYPRITREMQKKGEGEFIGPYTSSFTSKQTVEEVNRVFMLPTCRRVFPRDFKKERPCLNYQIKRCIGLCRGCISKEDYAAIIREAEEYIKSGSTASVEAMTEEMEKASENLEFERAAVLRDRIAAVKRAAETQIVFEKDIPDCDVIALSRNGEECCAAVLNYRGGRLTDKSDFILGDEEEDSETRADFLMQYYSYGAKIPKEILLDSEPDSKEELERFFREKSAHAVHINVPKRGELTTLVDMARSNARERLSLNVGRSGHEIAVLEDLGKLLGLPKPPLYIECYDISNLASSSMVGGMVVLDNGRPAKRFYKKFSIKTVDEQNDYASMQEVLHRRFENYFDPECKDTGFATMPDLIFLDGGRGHVAAVAPMLKDMGVPCPVYGLVKDGRHRTRAVISPEGGEIVISKNRAVFNLLTRLQDEVHRFTIAYQTNRHRRESLESELMKIPGIGPKKAEALFRTFKTKQALKEASPKEIATAMKISEEKASEVIGRFISEIK